MYSNKGWKCCRRTCVGCKGILANYPNGSGQFIFHHKHFLYRIILLRDHNDERQQPLPFEEMELNGPLPSPIARRKKSANN